MLVRQPCPIPAEASEVHGIYDATVIGKPSLAEIAHRFVERVAAAPIVVAYNAPFDLAILERTCPGFAGAMQGRVVLDPLVVVRLPDVGKFWGGKGRHKLANVCAKMKLPIPGNAHRAAADAIMAGLVLWRFRDRLPADAAEAAAFLAEARVQQDADFEAWRARQPVTPP